MLSAITGRQTCCHIYPQLKSVDSTDENIARNGSSDRNRHRGEHVFAHREDSIRRAPTKTTSPQYRPRPINLSRRPTSGDDDAEAAATTAAAPASPVAVPAFWPISNSSTDRMPVAARGVCSSTASGCNCDSPRRWSLFCFTAVSASSSSSSPKCTPSHAVEIQGREENEQEHHHHRHNSHYYLQMKHPHHGQQEHNRPAAAQDFDIPNREDASTAAASAAAERRGRGDFVNENAGSKEEDEAGWSDSSSQASNENIHSEPQPAVDTITTAAAETKKLARKFPFGMKLGSLWRKRRREGTALVFINQGSTSAPSEFQLRSPAAPASTTTTTEKGNFRSAIQSSFGGRRQFAKAQRGSVVGKIAMVTALACSSVFQNAQGKLERVCALLTVESKLVTTEISIYALNWSSSNGRRSGYPGRSHATDLGMHISLYMGAYQHRVVRSQECVGITSTTSSTQKLASRRTFGRGSRSVKPMEYSGQNYHTRSLVCTVSSSLKRGSIVPYCAHAFLASVWWFTLDSTRFYPPATFLTRCYHR